MNLSAPQKSSFTFPWFLALLASLLQLSKYHFFLVSASCWWLLPGSS